MGGLCSEMEVVGVYGTRASTAIAGGTDAHEALMQERDCARRCTLLALPFSACIDPWLWE